jgi:hypothetical protein
VRHRLGVQRIDTSSSLASLDDKSRLSQNPQMTRDGWSTGRETLGEFVHACVTEDEAVENPSTRRVREGSKDLGLEGLRKASFF